MKGLGNVFVNWRASFNSFVWINHYTLHTERPSSLNCILPCLPKLVNNIPNHKFSYSHIITVYVWYRPKKLFIKALSFSHQRKLALFPSHVPHPFWGSYKGFHFLCNSHFTGVKRPSTWPSQPCCLDCHQCDSAKAVNKYSRFLYLHSTKIVNCIFF